MNGEEGTMRIIALGQQKGGVGKTAAAINLACYAVASNAKTALIDMDDGQWTAVKWGKRRNGLPDAPSVFSADAVSLRPLLAQLREQTFAWVFIDLPGRHTASASAGLRAADLVLLPLRATMFDLESSVTTQEALRAAKRRYAYLLNDVSAQDRLARAMDVQMQLSNKGHPVVPCIIVHRAEVSNAQDVGRSCVEMFPNGRAAKEIAEVFAWIEREVQA